MALSKTIVLDNGVITNYHRVVSLNKITNQSNIIEIASYTSEGKRKEEIEKQGQPTNIFIKTTYLNKVYDEAETIEDIYDYLKTTEMFKDSTDV